MSHEVPRYRFLPFAFERRPEPEMRARAKAFADELALRRSVRAFRSDPVPEDVLDHCVRAASSAPSGANRQPWTFVVVTDVEKKRAIRRAAEEEERRSYAERMNDEWLTALEPLGTNWEKPFLETAPALIVVFRHAYSCAPGPWSTSSADHERRFQNYYTQESVGIACGFLIAALHHAGLATLTHTPSPMGFLGRVLGRPENEKAFLLLPVGYPAEDCTVPDIARKPIELVRVRV
ncbi:MAG: nitroreductase family protein [Planctomycetes bacterium]|nr:nitroreductase family protein [Planctomycetota bacterium]